MLFSAINSHVSGDVPLKLLYLFNSLFIKMTYEALQGIYLPDEKSLMLVTVEN